MADVQETWEIAQGMEAGVTFSLGNRFNAIINPNFFRGSGTPTGGRMATAQGGTTARAIFIFHRII